MSKKNPDYGDPLDYPDIPPVVELNQDYLDAVTPEHVKQAIAKRRALRDAEKLAAE